MKKLNRTEAVLRQEIIARKLATEEQLDGELSISFMQNCHSKVNLYLSLVRPEDVDATYNKPARIEAGKEQAKKNRARQWWNLDGATRVQEAGKIAGEFQQLFPQFASIEENTVQIVNFIKSQDEIFSLENVISAYQTLCSQGLIWVTPENCGLVGGEAVRGKMLTSIRNWQQVLEPVKILSNEEKEQQRIAGLDSESYRREFLPKDDVPALILKRIESDIRQFCKQHPEYDPTPEGRTILTNWIKEQGLPVGHDSLEAAYAATKEQLHQANSIFDSGPSIPVRYNASTLVDHRKPVIPATQREVIIKEPDSVKRFSLQEILAWDSATMQKMLNQFPYLENQINNM